ncbi:YitT family protein [Enterococcus canis]|uniref:YitT family protein n=1 Tax=Enterococcus canis TaxID=214095 RepID=A0A1L8RHN6_9ENTE|nr:YitT family protein [Enterococcus canis]OJG19215.1 YitT family protein [Enterococcus canis]
MKKIRYYTLDIIMILLGTCLYAFGLVAFNIANHLAEGGVTGITLILRYLFNIDPALSTLLINIPLILIGGKILGRRSLFYTIFGTVSLSFFLFIWQRVPFDISVDHDLLIASLLAGMAGGFGSGLVYRAGGTTGGTDIIARILEKKIGVSMGRSLLAFDVFVLTMSLVYLDLKHMMYTLIASFVFAQIVDFVQDGAYAAKGIFVVSNESVAIGEQIMETLERGVSYFDGEGGFSHEPKKILYVVVSPREVMEVRHIIEETDAYAFVSVINVHEAIGEGFTYLKPPRKLMKRLQRK